MRGSAASCGDAEVYVVNMCLRVDYGGPLLPPPHLGAAREQHPARRRPKLAIEEWDWEGERRERDALARA